MKINDIGTYLNYEGCYFTASGKAYRTIGPELQEITGTRIGKRGHVIMTIAGRTVYLGRMIYCLFNDLNYDDFNGRIKYLDGQYDNCSVSNLTVEQKFAVITKSKRKTVDPWAIRQMFCAGQQATQIAVAFGISADRVRAVCLGFENVGIEQLASIIRVIG